MSLASLGMCPTGMSNWRVSFHTAQPWSSRGTGSEIMEEHKGAWPWYRVTFTDTRGLPRGMFSALMMVILVWSGDGGGRGIISVLYGGGVVGGLQLPHPL